MKYILPLFLLFFVSCATIEDNIKTVTPRLQCVVERGTFDIGSGSTKFTLAKVDLCKNKIVSVLAKKNFALKYKEHISFTNGVLKESIFQKATKEIGDFLNTLPIKRSQIVGVATEVFRQASNGKSFIKRLSQNLNIKIHLISQVEEAMIGFKGAEIITGRDPETLFVWDIGGGSMQMTFGDDNDYEVYEGKLASVSLKNKVLEWMGKSIGSPNPLGELTGKRTLAYVEKYAKEDLPEDFIEEAKRREVIGIGGVHYFSVRDQLNIETDVPYSKYQIQKAFEKHVNYSDRELQGNYRETEVTNLALILGYMNTLGIKTVMPERVNLSTGLLFSEKYW